MKIRPRCSICLLQRGWKEIQLATDDRILQFEVLKAIIELFAKEFQAGAVSAILGTKRDRIIRKMTKCPDPYKRHKVKSNTIALQLTDSIEAYLRAEKDSYRRFRRAMLVAIVGNILEFDILEHTVDLDNPTFLNQLIKEAEQDLAIDHIPQIYQLIQKSKEVLFLTDNAGEIILDKYLILELLNLGINVIVAVKKYPVLNDATMEDAEVAGLIELSQINSHLQIITTGNDHVGLLLEEISDEFRPYFEDAQFIIAKGMGYYETLTEKSFQIPIVHLFRTKCSSVAEDVGVKLGQNVALLRLPET
ncbi:MAG: damage-control phosphatase ARMT1 family protein [Candidatus Helarchaeota archaeon]